MVTVLKFSYLFSKQKIFVCMRQVSISHVLVHLSGDRKESTDSIMHDPYSGTIRKCVKSLGSCGNIGFWRKSEYRLSEC